MSQPKPRSWWSSPRAIFRQILMLDDTAHSIALGATLGMFIGMTPTVGVQMILVVAVAFLARPFFRFNRMAALIMVYISNPITTLPIYWFNYKVGSWFLGGDASYHQFAAVLEYNGFAQWWETITQLYINFGYPLLVGSLLVAVICSAITYPTIFFFRCKLGSGGHQKEDEQQESDKDGSDSSSHSSSTPAETSSHNQTISAAG